MLKNFIKLILISFMIYSTHLFAENSQKNILIYGDSLSAEYGIPIGKGWNSLLKNKLKQEKFTTYNVINASISGETTTGGRARFIKDLTQHNPKIVILELGANDGLRGLPIDEAKANLASMIDDAQKLKIDVLLVGIQVPPNYGKVYAKKFDQMYLDLKSTYKVSIVPFMFSGLTQKREYFQQDNLHPTVLAQPIILETIWKELKPMLK